MSKDTKRIIVIEVVKSIVINYRKIINFIFINVFIINGATIDD